MRVTTSACTDASVWVTTSACTGTSGNNINTSAGGKKVLRGGFEGENDSVGLRAVYDFDVG